jgi:hypothetical protein
MERVLLAGSGVDLDAVRDRAPYLTAAQATNKLQ